MPEIYSLLQPVAMRTTGSLFPLNYNIKPLVQTDIKTNIRISNILQEIAHLADPNLRSIKSHKIAAVNQNLWVEITANKTFPPQSASGISQICGENRDFSWCRFFMAWGVCTNCVKTWKENHYLNTFNSNMNMRYGKKSEKNSRKKLEWRKSYLLIW